MTETAFTTTESAVREALLADLADEHGCDVETDDGRLSSCQPCAERATRLAARVKHEATGQPVDLTDRAAVLVEVERRIIEAAPEYHGGSMLPHASASDCPKCGAEIALRAVRAYAAETRDQEPNHD